MTPFIWCAVVGCGILALSLILDGLTDGLDDIFFDGSLPVIAAALGVSLPVETLDGERMVSVRAGTQSGDSIRLDGLGVGRLRRPGRGDLHVSIVVETPTRLTEREKELLTELAELRGETVVRRESWRSPHADQPG